MTVETHEFKEHFVAGKKVGFALLMDSHLVPPTAPSFLTRKLDNHHLWMDVFESEWMASEEVKQHPENLQPRIKIKEVSVSEVSAFSPVGYFGIPCQVFVRNQEGLVAKL